MTINWKQLAWNGIRFETPAQWEVGQIGARHLVLEDDAGPAMEVKWGAVKGIFSHKTHLKRLAALQSRRNHISVAEWILPPPWETALADFETAGFLWQSPEASGRGAILFCPACRTATLIQFFGDSSFAREKIFLAILESFCDHSQDGWLPWSIFDIRASLPQYLKLERFQFEAGKYMLAFSAGSHHIYLHRWAPAAALLAGRDLVAFAGTVPEFAGGGAAAITVDTSDAVEWKIGPGSDWGRMLSRFRVRPSFGLMRMWILQEQNRILGIRSESKHPLDVQLVDQICEHYESL